MYNETADSSSYVSLKPNNHDYIRFNTKSYREFATMFVNGPASPPNGLMKTKSLFGHINTKQRKYLL